MAFHFFRRSAPKKPQPIRTRSVPLQVEYLERREMPATFLVTNTGDNGGVDPLAGAGTGTLRQAIVNANADTTAGVVDVIKFKASLSGATINLAANLPTITDDVRITGIPTGPRVRVDGGDLFRIFEMNDGGTGTINVSLSRLQLQDGFSGVGQFGGAILNSGAENLTILSSILSGNTADARGGAVSSIGGVLQIKNSRFSDNSATIFSGGAVHAGGGNVLIQSSTFTGNTAGDSGGALYGGPLDGLVIRGSSFKGANTAADSGGAVFLNGIGFLNGFGGDFLIEGSTISGNTATGGDGGGVYLGGFNYYGNKLTIHKTTISGNSAGDDGGGLFVDNPAVVLIQQSKVQNNTAADAGGGIWFVGDNFSDSLTVERSSITGNTASSGSGGGIYQYGGAAALTVQSSTVSGNTAGDAGGGIAIVPYYDSGNGDLAGDVTIQNSTISDNTAGSSGGGLFLFAPDEFLGSLRISGSTLSGNIAANSGGAVYLDAEGSAAGTEAVMGVVQILSSTITNNTATNGNGGGVYLNSYYGSGNYGFGSVLVHKTTIAGNSAGNQGGGFWSYDSDSEAAVVFDSSTISGNTAANAGGGIWLYADDGTLLLRNSTVSGNAATAGNGGGIYIQTAEEPVRLDNSTIAFNTADGILGNGGGIFTYDGDVVLLSTIVGRNSANVSGNDLAGGPGNNFEVTFSLVEDATVGGDAGFNDNGFNVLNVNPRLKPLAKNGGPTRTHALQNNSPAINKGFNFSGSPFDQRGKTRTRGTATDIGAVEQR